MSQTKSEPLVTIITPTYNREKLLKRLYESLLSQTELGFEWIIIDDGSNDSTQHLASRWAINSPFEIVYVKQKNRGKAAAYNHGVSLAKCIYLACVDSDDWLPKDAIKNKIALMEMCNNLPSICGVTGVCVRADNSIIGTKFLKEGITGSKVSLDKLAPGDKANVFKTKILKKFPFPHFFGEKFLPEGIIYNRMHQAGYQFISTNTTLKIVEYQSGGLSDTALKMRLDSINGTIAYYQEMSLMNFPLQLKFRSQANKMRYTLHKLGFKKVVLNSFLLVIALPVALLLYSIDKWKMKNIIKS